MHVQMHQQMGHSERCGAMTEISNGVSADDLPGIAWRKSTYSGAVGNCVELGRVGERGGVRNSRDPHGPVLVVPAGALRSLVGSV
jgi:hypothetical protein